MVRDICRDTTAARFLAKSSAPSHTPVPHCVHVNGQLEVFIRTPCILPFDNPRLCCLVPPWFDPWFNLVVVDFYFSSTRSWTQLRPLRAEEATTLPHDSLYDTHRLALSAFRIVVCDVLIVVFKVVLFRVVVVLRLIDRRC